MNKSEETIYDETSVPAAPAAPVVQDIPSYPRYPEVLRQSNIRYALVMARKTMSSFTKAVYPGEVRPAEMTGY